MSVFGVRCDCVMKPLNSDKKKSFMTYVFLIGPLLLLIYYSKELPIVSFNQSYVYGVFIYGLYGLVWMIDTEGKYLSPQAIFNGGHLCINRPPQFHGMWAVFTDGIQADKLMYFRELKSTVVIVPKALVYKIGSYYVSNVKISKIDGIRMPYSAQIVVDSYRYRTDNIWFGIAGDDIDLKTENILKSLQEEMQQVNDRANRSVNYARGNLSDWQGTIGDVSGTLKEIAPDKKSILRSLSDSLKARKEDE